MLGFLRISRPSWADIASAYVPRVTVSRGLGRTLRPSRRSIAAQVPPVTGGGVPRLSIQAPAGFCLLCIRHAEGRFIISGLGPGGAAGRRRKIDGILDIWRGGDPTFERFKARRPRSER
jgi:hypothetical protein